MKARYSIFNGRDDSSPDRQMRHIYFILLVLMPCMAAGINNYLTYINARYGYSIEYPANFVPQGVSDAGDGQVFISPDWDAELRVFASACVGGMDSTPAEYVAHYKRREKNQELTLTYDRAGRDFAVVAGVKNGRVFYNKVLIDTEGWCTEFNFVYDSNKSRAYDQATSHIAATFRR